MENRLLGKTIIWNGDSICCGGSNCGSWAERIAKANDMTFKNYAKHGGTVVDAELKTASGNDRHSVAGTLDIMYTEHPEADYIIIEGGTNDADLDIANVGAPKEHHPTLGVFNPNYFGEEYDVSTFCGALESVFCRAIKYWMGKKIGYIVAQKMGTAPTVYENRRRYFDKAVEICKKWGIPYIDLWEGCYLNPNLPWMYHREKTPEENKAENIGFYIDGQHLTSRGYDLTADIIEAWLKSL